MDRIETIKHLLTENPNDIFLNYALAMEYMSLSDWNSSIDQLEWIRSKHPDYLALYYQLAHVYEKLNNSNMAIEVYEQGIELAIKLSDKKTQLELKSALEELTF
jgi:predicted Zn-dependent protease